MRFIYLIDLMKTHISDMKLILDTILKKKIVKFINHDAKELDKEERLTSFKEWLQRVVEKELGICPFLFNRCWVYRTTKL